jgi:hypothetical protein
MQSLASGPSDFVTAKPKRMMFPFRNGGKDLVAALSAAHDLAREFQLLRKAERFAANVFQWEMDS